MGQEDGKELLRKRLVQVPMGPGGEFDLIRSLVGRGGSLPPGVLLGSGDDCTALEGGVVVSTDYTVEGVHFLREWISLEEAGYRAASSGLSDLAAMAAEPRGILLAMALDPTRASEEAAQVQRGAEEACGREGVRILGGDLSSSPGPLILNVVALGQADSPILRAGTEIDDEVWVTGRLGGSGAAVALWSEGRTPPADLREAFARPKPRIREALWLAKRIPIHGLIDISDGLAGDAGHLAAASRLSLVLREEAIPCHPALLGDLWPAGELGPGSARYPLHFSLEGGEDYELCFTAPPGSVDDWISGFQGSFGIPLTKVGWAIDGEGVLLESPEGGIEPLKRLGFSHFACEEDG